MRVRNGARVTALKYETPQGRIVVERDEKKSNKSKRSQSTVLLELSVLVEFLNLQYDENGIAIWSRQTSHLGFLFPPFLHMYRGITVEQLRGFYAETRQVQADMRELLSLVLTTGNKTRLKKSINSAEIPLTIRLDLEDSTLSEWRGTNFGGLGVYPQLVLKTASFRTYVYWLLHNLYYSGHMGKLGICKQCSTFFARPADLGFGPEMGSKHKHCSKECRRMYDEQNSGQRHIDQDNRMKDWLADLLLKPTETAKQRQLIDPIVTSVFGGWKRFTKWKSEVEFASRDELVKSLTEDQKKIARARMKEMGWSS
jgi:hypothetical protein